jgi:signal transduction histidine kinase
MWLVWKVEILKNNKIITAPMKCILNCLLVLLLCGNSVIAQDTTWQSIQAAKDDTAKVIRLADYAFAVAATDEDKALKLYDELMRLSKKLNYPYWMGMTWFNIACIDANRANDKRSIENFRLALHYLNQTNRVDQIASCYLNISAVSERLGDVELKVSSLNKAIQLLESSRYKDLLNSAYNSMGVMLFNQEQYDKGLLYFKKAMQVAKEIKDTSNLVSALFGISNCLSKTNKFEEAEVYSKESLQVATLSRKNHDLCVANTSCSELYLKWKKAQPAIQYAEKILYYAKATNHVQYQLIGFINLGQAYVLAKETRKAIYYLNSALQLGHEKEVVLQLDDIYKGLSDAYALQGDHERSLDYYKKYIAYKDSSINEKNNKNIAELEIKYQTVQKEKALSQQQLQLSQKEVQLHRSQQAIVFSVAATLVALLVALLVFLHYRNKRRLHQQQLQAIQREKELQLLQATLEGEEKERSRIAKDLHDGVAGMLAAAKMQLGSLSIKNKELVDATEFVQAVKLLDDSCQEVRSTSHNLMPEILMQHGLSEAVRRYCRNISNAHVLQVQFAAYGTIDRFVISFELTVYRIVQELLNNIVKHSRATTASVQLSVQEDFLSITIEDNGVGFDKAKSIHSGTGLDSLQRRIQAMNGTLEIDAQQEQGVTAFIGIDISNYKR